MEYYLWPDWLQPETFEIGLRSHVAVTSNTYTGKITTQELPGSRWIVRATFPPSVGGDRQAEVEAFFAKVRGQANRIQMWHLKRPIPRGTLRGSPVLVTSALQGIVDIVIQGAAGSTLLPGDMIGVTTTRGVQLVQVTQASGSGNISAKISPPLKANANVGSTIYWYRPLGSFIPLSSEIMVPYGKYGVDPGVSIDLVEV